MTQTHTTFKAITVMSRGSDSKLRTVETGVQLPMIFAYFDAADLGKAGKETGLFRTTSRKTEPNPHANRGEQRE